MAWRQRKHRSVREYTALGSLCYAQATGAAHALAQIYPLVSSRATLHLRLHDVCGLGPLFPALDSPTKASASPLGLNATPCTQPPAGVAHSPHTVPNGRRSPQTVGGGLASTPLIKALKTRARMSAQPAAISTLLGCQSRERTVLRRGRLMCLATHQSLSSSKEQIEMMLYTKIGVT